MKLHGKVAVVTGGLRGIGHAIALAMAQEGADLLIAGLSMDRAAQTEQEIGALGRRCVVVRADVADAAAVKAMIACTVQHFGGLDILVNNAGIAPFKPIDEFTSAEFSRVLDVNLKGPWLCAKYAFPELKRRGGVIINITSASGHYGGASAGGSALGGQAFVETQGTAQEIARTPLQRLGLPADVGKVAVFLACDDSSYITGTTIVLDGGAMAVW